MAKQKVRRPELANAVPRGDLGGAVALNCARLDLKDLEARGPWPAPRRYSATRARQAPGLQSKPRHVRMCVSSDRGGLPSRSLRNINRRPRRLMGFIRNSLVLPDAVQGC